MENSTAAASAELAESKWVEFRRSGIHGLGAFARKEIPDGTRVIEYVGQMITKAESLKRCEENNEFIFTISDTHDLDGNVGWNPAKFINHSCAPNCTAELIEGRIWIITARDIRPEEELTFNYGYELENFRDHICRCGAAECVGYMVAEEYFPTVRASTDQGDETTTEPAQGQ